MLAGVPGHDPGTPDRSPPPYLGRLQHDTHLPVRRPRLLRGNLRKRRGSKPHPGPQGSVKAVINLTSGGTTCGCWPGALMTATSQWVLKSRVRVPPPTDEVGVAQWESARQRNAAVESRRPRASPARYVPPA